MFFGKIIQTFPKDLFNYSIGWSLVAFDIKPVVFLCVRDSMTFLPAHHMIVKTCCSPCLY